VDRGGVARELFAIALRDFIASRGDVLGVCGDHNEQLWFTRQGAAPVERLSGEYLLGVLVGLACYNGILVNLPIVPTVYKIWRKGTVSACLLLAHSPIVALNMVTCAPVQCRVEI
jgi:hypothetical protein